MGYVNYRKKDVTEMRPYVPGEDLTFISVGKTDTPEEGGMIARNAKIHIEQWYIAKQDFERNYELPTQLGGSENNSVGPLVLVGKGQESMDKIREQALRVGVNIVEVNMELGAPVIVQTQSPETSAAEQELCRARAVHEYTEAYVRSVGWGNELPTAIKACIDALLAQSPGT